MNTLRLLFAAACLWAAVSTARAATAVWDGGGGNSSWQTASNWVGDAVPGSGDDVLINVLSNLTVSSSANVIVKSLQCSNNLAIIGGTFGVTTDASMVQGTLSMSSGTALSAGGPGTSFIANGLTTVNDANFSISGGAVLSLPRLSNFTKDCVGANWTVSGSNSVLNLPGLTNITGIECSFPLIQATAGGHLLATNLTTITAGPLTFRADGTNSLVDFSGLRTCSGNPNYMLAFEARNGGTVLAPALTTLSNADLSVSGGSFLSLPELRNFTKGCAGANWTVSGSNSVLNLSGLTNISGTACDFPVIQTTAGGHLLATNLTTITAGPLTFLADGAGSLVDFSGLRTCSGNPNYALAFEARNGGTVLLTSIASVATMSGVNLMVSSGGVLSVPGLHNFMKDCVGANWTVSGSNSVLNLPGLTNITGAACDFPVIQATAGGHLLATNLTTITAGPLTFLADGAGSLVDFSGLRTCSGNPNYALAFEARNGGTVLLTPIASVATMFGVNLMVSGGGVLLVPGLRNFTKDCVGANWTVSGSNSVLNLPGLTNITVAACDFPVIQATAGGHLLATNLTTITAGPLTLRADGAGSLVDFSGLRTCSGNPNYAVVFEARNGGTVLAPALTSLNDADLNVSGGSLLLTSMASVATMYDVNLMVSGGGVLSAPGLRNFTKDCIGANWTVSGSNSVLNLPGLTNITGIECSFPLIQATAGGHLLATNLTTITAGPLTFLTDGAGSLLDFSGLRTCSGNPNYALAFEARNGGTVLAPALTTLSNADLSVSGGSFLSLPGLRNFTKGCAGANWTVSGSNSVLNLPGLTNITGIECSFPLIQATAGGHLLATNLTTITAGPLAFLTDGAGSLVDFSGLRTCSGNPNFALAFEARNGGTVLLTPIASVATMYGVNLMVSSGGVLSVPGLRNFTKDCVGANWTVSGLNSVLNLPGLTNITGIECSFPLIQATAGGHLLATNLTTITAGPLTFRADGTNSLVDFSGLRTCSGNPNYMLAFEARNGGTVDLSGLTNFQGEVALEVQNGGKLLFTGQPFFTTGVTINIPPAAPILQPTLIFHGKVWHSYKIEMRDTLQPQNPWIFVTRIPVTNDFLAFAPSLPPNTEFRAIEFVADPPILDLWRLPAPNVQLVLYGATNKTYAVQSTNRLTETLVAWPILTTVGMTNSFRILPPTPTTEPHLFFRAKE